MHVRRKVRIVLTAALALAGCDYQTAPAPPSPAARNLVGSAAAGDDSLQRLRDLSLRSPDDAAAQAAYGLAAERAAQYAQALAALDRAVSAGGLVPERLLAQGRIALEAGDVPAAELAFQRTLDAAPGNVDALNGLGVADDLRHAHAQAQARYRQALGIAPGDWVVRSNLAMSCLMAGQADRAVDALAGADQDASAPRRARQDLALALVATGRRDDALRVLRADVAAEQASTLAEQFAGFAAWLAKPDGDIK